MSEEERFINEACCGLLWHDAVSLRMTLLLAMGMTEKALKLRREVEYEFEEADRRGR